MSLMLPFYKNSVLARFPSTLSMRRVEDTLSLVSGAQRHCVFFRAIDRLEAQYLAVSYVIFAQELWPTLS